jgi:SAM-dependent methyltransferase
MSHSAFHAAGAMPEPWVLRATPLVPPGGHVIDVACGTGRHGRWFLANDHPVTFVDRDTSAVEDLAGRASARVVAADLEAPGFDPATVLPPGGFAAVIVVNYLWRPLLPAIIAAVGPGGLLVYQTFAAGNERFGKPSNPDFLLQPGELLEAVRGTLQVLAYEHGEGLLPRPAVIQRILARKGA